MGFAGTSRKRYTKERVREMRIERKKKQPTIEGVSYDVYQSCLGDLIGAGHLRMVGFQNMTDEKIQRQNVLGDDCTFIKKNISVENLFDEKKGERPHLIGYLSSGHKNDPNFRIKGWFNSDGTVRIELVK